MFITKDMLGRELLFDRVPKRIISVVPSQTELLYDLGLEDEVIAITKFCIHPENWFRTKERIGGTKNLDLDRIRELKPDLIIANKEENSKADIEELSDEFPVWVSDIYNLDDAQQMIQQLGNLLGKDHMAQAIARMIEKGFSSIKSLHKKQRALYLIWQNPWMSVNRDTFIHDMIQRLGLENVTSEFGSRYPQLSAEEIKILNPQLVLLSSEPYPFKEKHISQLQALLPNSRIGLVDGEAFSWYGSRLVQSPPYFIELLKKWN
ncbi:MAG: helical backbone metal receptor [Bacteroidia bacterium]